MQLSYLLGGDKARTFTGRRVGLHPATLTFQALRIAVNRELSVSEDLLRHLHCVVVFLSWLFGWPYPLIVSQVCVQICEDASAVFMPQRAAGFWFEFCYYHALMLVEHKFMFCFPFVFLPLAYQIYLEARHLNLYYTHTHIATS